MHLSFNLLENWIKRTFSNCNNFRSVIIHLGRLKNAIIKCEEEVVEQKLKEKDDFKTGF